MNGPNEQTTILNYLNENKKKILSAYIDRLVSWKKSWSCCWVIWLIILKIKSSHLIHSLIFQKCFFFFHHHNHCGMKISLLLLLFHSGTLCCCCCCYSMTEKKKNHQDFHTIQLAKKKFHLLCCSNMDVYCVIVEIGL